MSPRSPDSLSEGEIVSGDEEKAINTTTRISKDDMVNKSTRLPPSESSSRSAQPFETKTSHSSYRHRDDARIRDTRDRSRSPYRRDRIRSRSRSPYRATTSGSGLKRVHDDDHYWRKGGSDPRRFKVHYEDKDPPRHISHDPRRPFADLDRSFSSKGQSLRDEELANGCSPTHKLHADAMGRSRSPYRHGRYERNGHGASSELKARSGNTMDDRPGTASIERQSFPQTGVRNQYAKSQAIPHPVAGATEADRGAEATSAHPTEEAHGRDEPEVTLSEADLIEQRRKRREAIKARHKNSQPLLVQALEQNLASAPSTPLHDTSPESSEQQSPPSSFNSPSTPRRDSPPDSPAHFAVSNDEELVELRPADVAGDDEGPSAADYDPNTDMQEDRPDHKKQDLRDSGVIGGTEPTPDVPKDVQQIKEYDMFADEDDDDMFAPDDVVGKTVATVKQARALDQSLLDNWDYPDGHYRIILGELLDGRYAMQQQIGKGTFATVVRATDTRDGSPVAVKIACNNETMYKAGQKEMDMLSLLNQSDQDDKKHIIRLIRHFEHKGHLCLVFENLSADLREVLKKFGRNVGLNLKAIRSYAQQMFLALSHMKKCQILHADLKPDNILVSEKRSILKICDLGTASFAADAEVTPYLVSRFYRAPEVILGIPFDYAIDMWSIGCTLFELYTGRILFAGADNNQMLRAIQECRGKFPLRMLKRATLVDKHFDAAGTFYSQERDRVTGKPTARPMNYNKTVPGKDLRARLSGNLKGMSPDEIKEHASFVDLMNKCLQLDPARRVTPNEALRHSFVAHGGAAPQQGERRSEPVRVAMNIPRRK